MAKKKAKAKALVTHFDAHVAKSHVVALQNLAKSINLSPEDLWALVVQFGSESIPIIMDVLKAFAGGFDWAKLTQLLLTDGPKVIAIVKEIAAALGKTVPPVPVTP